jgi:hypothetical protein
MNSREIVEGRGSKVGFMVFGMKGGTSQIRITVIYNIE